MTKTDGTIFEFLLGEKSFDGKWYGEIHKPAYWWRKHLRDAINKIKSNVSTELETKDYCKDCKTPLDVVEEHYLSTKQIEFNSNFLDEHWDNLFSLWQDSRVGSPEKFEYLSDRIKDFGVVAVSTNGNTYYGRTKAHVTKKINKALGTNYSEESLFSLKYAKSYSVGQMPVMTMDFKSTKK